MPLIDDRPPEYLAEQVRREGANDRLAIPPIIATTSPRSGLLAPRAAQTRIGRGWNGGECWVVAAK